MEASEQPDGTRTKFLQYPHPAYRFPLQAQRARTVAASAVAFAAASDASAVACDAASDASAPQSAAVVAWAAC